jgi:RNA polymerase sigma-70 factor (ECF subfamily)
MQGDNAIRPVSHADLSLWYSKYGALVHRRCRTLMGNEADANDALQETFMRAHRTKRDDVMQPLPWLYSIATRICFDQLESRKRRGVLGSLKLMIGFGESAAGQGSVEDKLCMGSALVTLDAQTREMALLHWLDGLTQEEVAQQTGFSRKTVGVKLREAESKLRVVFGPELPEVTAS